jgi:hypothetical protein
MRFFSLLSFRGAPAQEQQQNAPVHNSQPSWNRRRHPRHNLPPRHHRRRRRSRRFPRRSGAPLSRSPPSSSQTRSPSSSTQACYALAAASAADPRPTRNRTQKRSSSARGRHHHRRRPRRRRPYLRADAAAPLCPFSRPTSIGRGAASRRALCLLSRVSCGDLTFFRRSTRSHRGCRRGACGSGWRLPLGQRGRQRRGAQQLGSCSRCTSSPSSTLSRTCWPKRCGVES